MTTPELKVVEADAAEEFDLSRFKSKRGAVGTIEVLPTALPHHKVAQAKDFVRLHPDEENYWSEELCFVNVPIKGQKRDTLHLIDEELAMRYLPSGAISRCRLALAAKPYDVFFLAEVPSQNLEESLWNATNIQGCMQAKTSWVKLVSLKDENKDMYRIVPALDQDSLPEPHWPSQSLNKLITLTFEGRMIMAPDHPGLLRLRGAKNHCVVIGYGRAVVVDFEYEASDGNLPDVLCMVAYELDGNLQLVRNVRRWRGEFETEPPFDIGPDTLFVAYSAWAEMTCFKVLGWKFPARIFDQHTAYLAASNILLPQDDEEQWRKKPRKRLPDACRAYGLAGWEQVDKDSISKDIGEGRWEKYGKNAVMAYCEEDVRMEVQLLRAQLRGHFHLRAADVERVIFWSEYSAKCVALIQSRGMYIDVPLWNATQENKAAVITELLRQLDPSHGTACPIFDQDGSYEQKRLENWLAQNGVTAWPRTPTGIISTKRDSFRLMTHIPGVEAISALKDSLRVITSAKLPIGRDGRNRPSIFPFGTATGRNAHSKSLFNAHAGMRSFMVAPPGKILVYLDWRTQEVAVAAARSQDPGLLAAYRGGDVYHTLAVTSGLANEPDQRRWKNDNPAQREQMKRLQLAINYGMGVPSLARGLDRHPLVASTIIEKHRHTYPRYWQWRDWVTHVALQERRIESALGWGLDISHTPNERTLYNFPMQSGGADMLRLAVCRLCREGLVPSMLVHDGILLELDNEEQVEQAREIMCWAGRQVCDGLDVDASVDKRMHRGERFLDKRPMAVKMWNTVAIGVRLAS